MKNFEKFINETKYMRGRLGIYCVDCPAYEFCDAYSRTHSNPSCGDNFKKWAFAEATEATETPTKQWRPFKDTDELIAEFCKRFGVEKTSWGLPLIWVKQKGYDNEELVTDLCGTTVKLGIILIRLDNFFEDYTFLDYSPCGVLEEVEDDD